MTPLGARRPSYFSLWPQTPQNASSRPTADKHCGQASAFAIAGIVESLGASRAVGCVGAAENAGGACTDEDGVPAADDARARSAASRPDLSAASAPPPSSPSVTRR